VLSGIDSQRSGLSVDNVFRLAINNIAILNVSHYLNSFASGPHRDFAVFTDDIGMKIISPALTLTNVRIERDDGIIQTHISPNLMTFFAILI